MKKIFGNLSHDARHALIITLAMVTITCAVITAISRYRGMHPSEFALSYSVLIVGELLLTIAVLLFEHHDNTSQPTRSDHGLLFTDVAESIRHERYEYLAMFSLNCRKLAEGTNRSTVSCDLTAKDWGDVLSDREPALVFDLHNHPGISTCFSPNDVYSLISRGLRFSVLVTRNHNFILSDPIGRNLTEPERHVRALEISQDMENLCLMWALPYSLPFATTKVSIRIVEHIAAKYGLEFETFSAEDPQRWAGLARYL